MINSVFKDVISKYLVQNINYAEWLNKWYWVLFNVNYKLVNN